MTLYIYCVQFTEWNTRVSPSYDMELLHFLSKLYIHVTHVWEIYNVKEGEGYKGY